MRLAVENAEPLELAAHVGLALLGGGRQRRAGRADRAVLDELVELRAALQAAQAELAAIRERERERSPSNYHRRRTSAAAAYGSIPIRHATSLGTWAELGGAFLCLLTKRLAHD